MSTPTANLLLLEDLEDGRTTSDLAERDRRALRAVADWIRTYVIQPHEDLGRPGPVCPFVPRSLERERLWLAPERIGDAGGAEVAERMAAYQRLLHHARPADGQDARDDVIVVVFTDLAADRAKSVFDDVLQRLAKTAYAADGTVFGPFYEGHEGRAIHNPRFRPFQSPVPFLFVRHGVVGDWKFFLHDDEWLTMWARRFQVSAVHALADELRRLPWARSASDGTARPIAAHHEASARRSAAPASAPS